MASQTPQRSDHRLLPTSLGTRTWFGIVIIGLVGQIAWAVENLYLNVFVYDTITDDPTIIATMVALSAVSATGATFVIGPLSDRLGKRRVFIVSGYMLWGISTMLFGFVTVEGVAAFVPAASIVTATAAAVILLDCVMSFLGAGANDASFNAWVTDITSPANRGRVESVLAMLPLLAMLLVFGGLDGLTKKGDWQLFFLVVGALMIVAGFVALLLIRDAPGEPVQQDGLLRSIVHGLRPDSVRANPRLYWTLVAFAILGVSTQVFLPYLIIYVQRYLRIEAYALVLAVVLTGAAIVSVLGGRIIDRVGKVAFMLPAAGIYLIGLLLMVVARGLIPVIGAGLVMMSGFMLTMATIGAAVRDYSPPDRVGMVQGLRMIAMVLVPMVFGPFIGAAVIRGADEYYEDLGQLKQVPTPGIFVAAAVVVLLIVIPVRALRRGTPSA
ncbi:MAG TPA: MFS transporter [Actinomycetota bacterium]|nr:MFS transporter [Actinomycetota bacterium]